jgi:TRAP-type mannitol/chloroaromatic compound transport system substrate-binding protein
MSKPNGKRAEKSSALSRRRMIGAAAGAVATGLGLATTRRASAQQPVATFKMQTGFGAKDPYYTISQDWVKKVEEMSGGRLKIDLLPVGAVVGAFQVIEAVHTGTLDGCIAVPVYWYSKNVNMSLFGTGPSWGLDAEGMLGWIHQGGGQQFYDELVQKEMKLDVQSFFGCPMPTQPLGWFKKGEIKSPNDLKGVKYRTVGLSADLFRVMGAAVTILAGPDIVPALDRGVIDGAEWNNTSADRIMGLPDVSKTYMLQSHHQPCEYLEWQFKKTKYDALPKDLQSILRHSVMAQSADMTWKFQDWNSKDLVEMREKQKVRTVKTPKAVLEAQLKAWDALIEEKGKNNPFWQKVTESQKAWAQRVVSWQKEVYVDGGQAYEHFFKKKV